MATNTRDPQGLPGSGRFFGAEQDQKQREYTSLAGVKVAIPTSVISATDAAKVEQNHFVPVANFGFPVILTYKGQPSGVANSFGEARTPTVNLDNVNEFIVSMERGIYIAEVKQQTSGALAAGQYTNVRLRTSGDDVGTLSFGIGTVPNSTNLDNGCLVTLDAIATGTASQYIRVLVNF